MLNLVQGIETYSPPSSVGFVVFELSRQEDSDKELEDTPLHTDNSDDTEDGMGSVPKLKEPKQLKEDKHTGDGTEVSEGSHCGAKLVSIRIQLKAIISYCLLFMINDKTKTYTRTEEDGDQEESNQEGHVPNNRTKSDDRNPYQTRLNLTVHGETLDEEVTDHEKYSQTDGADNFSNQNSLPRSPRHITRQLLTRETQPLALETSNPSSGQSTVTDPRVSMCSRVASRHPTNKFSVVDNKVSDGELVGVEEERRNTKTNNRNPEVDKMRNPNCKSDEEKNDEGTYTEIDRRSSESGAVHG